jgi:XTP/dITP diphosphohydrolase
MEDLTYITGNYGKYISVKEKFEKAGITIDYFKCDLEEPNINDIKIISKEKARQAFELLNSPVFVADSGFYIEDYPNKPGYPGAFVKRSGVSSNIKQLLETMKNTNNRNCYFLDCLTFFDGNEYYQFLGLSKGTLSNEIRGYENKKAKSNLWYVFIPNNCSKTLAEMSDEERNNRPDNRTSATDEFIEWYKLNYKSAKKRQKIYNKN